MCNALKLGAILAAATLWVSFAHAGTFHHGRYLPDYGGHGRHQHRDWSAIAMVTVEADTFTVLVGCGIKAIGCGIAGEA